MSVATDASLGMSQLKVRGSVVGSLNNTYNNINKAGIDSPLMQIRIW